MSLEYDRYLEDKNRDWVIGMKSSAENILPNPQQAIATSQSFGSLFGLKGVGSTSTITSVSTPLTLTGLQDLMNQLSNTFKEAWLGSLLTLSNLLDEAGQAVWSFIEGVHTGLGTLSGVFADTASWIAGIWNGGFRTYFDNLFNELTLIWKIIVDDLDFDDYQPTATSGGYATDTYSIFWNIAKIGKTVWETLEGIGSAIWTAISGIAEGIWTAVKTIGATVWSALSALGSAIWNSFTGLIGDFTKLWDASDLYITGIKPGTTGAPTGATYSIMWGAFAVGNFFRNLFEGDFSDLTDAADFLGEFITGLFSDAADFVGTIITNVFDPVNYATLQEKVLGVLNWNSIEEGVRDALSWTEEQVTNAGNISVATNDEGNQITLDDVGAWLTYNANAFISAIWDWLLNPVQEAHGALEEDEHEEVRTDLNALGSALLGTSWNVVNFLGLYVDKASTSTNRVGGGDIDMQTYDIRRVDRIFFESNDEIDLSSSLSQISVHDQTFTFFSPSDNEQNRNFHTRR